MPDELRSPRPSAARPTASCARSTDDELRRRLAALPDDVEAVAICLLWGFRHPEHEQAVEAAVDELLGDGVHVSTSHETAAVFREYERCVTTIVDATVSPLLGRYLERLTASAPRRRACQARRSCCRAAVWSTRARAARHGSWTVLSGPAGGAVAAASAARGSGADRAVALDMGGTSCDVSLVLGGGSR